MLASNTFAALDDVLELRLYARPAVQALVRLVGWNTVRVIVSAILISRA